MKLGYDNLEDARVKLNATFCLWQGRAITVKNITHDLGGKYFCTGTYMSTGRGFDPFPIDHPDFNCSNYNIGYVTTKSYGSWFYRLPGKQYKQGLRADQVGGRYSRPDFRLNDFNASKHVANMLENVYPNIEDTKKALVDGIARIQAFHRNFAATYDEVHKDFILEYKGVAIGHTSNWRDINMLKEHEHLAEALKEAI